MKMEIRLAYLSLQITREGQASYAHVHEIIKDLRSRGCTVDLWEPSSKTNLFAKILAFIWLQLRLSFQLRKYDLLYVRSHFFCLPVSLVAKCVEVPVIQELNGMYTDAAAVYPWTKPLMPVISAVMDVQLAMATAVVTVTDQFKEWVQKRLRSQRNVHVISNGADTNRFHPEAARVAGLAQNYALFFGALSPWQGLDLILDAVQQSLWPKEVGLVIAGDGFGRKKVEKAQQNGLVCYLGRVPYEKIPGLIAGSICSLVPKVDEGLGYSETGLAPLKLFESIACGTAVVVTDFPGMADIVRNDQCGIVIAQNDSLSLARAVRSLYENDELRSQYGKNGRTAAENKHSWKQKGGETFQLVEFIVNQPFSKRAAPLRGHAQ